MNALIQTQDQAALMERVLLAGDLSKLSNSDRMFYYSRVCESVGLNPLTRPFDYLQLNGKLVLYAKRDATDQLRKIHGVSVTISGRETIEGVHVVTARAKDKTGREDESTGAVTIANLKGDALANALMKAETKAKRRVTLSICGLGMLDETEIETIPNARTNSVAAAVAEISGTSDDGKTKERAEEAARMMREALEIAIDEKIYEMHQELNTDPSFYIAVSALLTAGDRRAWKEAVGRVQQQRRQ